MFSILGRRMLASLAILTVSVFGIALLDQPILTAQTFLSRAVGTLYPVSNALYDLGVTGTGGFAHLVLSGGAGGTLRIVPANPGANRDITLADPGGPDTLAYLTATQTLLNKTLTSPTLVSPTFSGTLTGDALFSSGRPWIDVMAKGAKCDGVTDDSAAFASAVTALPAGGGTIYIPQATSGCLLTTGWALNKSNLRVITDPATSLILGASVTIGSTSAVTTNSIVQLNVKGAATPPSILVAAVNTQDDQLDVHLTATCACDLLHVQSVGAVGGSADNWIHAWSSGPTDTNHVIFEAGNSSTASLANDFVNGNVCWKCDGDLPTTGTGAAFGFRGTGTFTGSVAGSVARNVLFRPDISQFNGNGNCVRLLSGNATYEELWEVTCETGGGTAAYSVDTTTAGGASGGTWRIYHPVMVGAYAAQHLGTTDTWYGDEQNNSQWIGTAGASPNLQTVTGSAITTITSTAFVSTGVGVLFTPHYLTQSTISCSSGGVLNATGGDGIQVAIYRGSSIPALNATVGTDTLVYSSQTVVSNNSIPWSVTIHDSGLTVGTQVAYYLAAKAVTGGTAQLLAANICYVTEQ